MWKPQTKMFINITKKNLEAIKEKIDKFDYIKKKNLVYQKTSSTKLEGKLHNRKNVCNHYINIESPITDHCENGKYTS